MALARRKKAAALLQQLFKDRAMNKAVRIPSRSFRQVCNELTSALIPAEREVFEQRFGKLDPNS